MPQYSDTAAVMQANQLIRSPLEPRDHGGRVRASTFKLTVSAVDMAHVLTRMPAGRIRILGISAVKVSFATGAATLSVGTGSYTDQDGSNKAAAATALKTATAGSTINMTLDAAGPRGLALNSRDGVDVIGTSSANLAVNDTIEGVVYYILD